MNELTVRLYDDVEPAPVVIRDGRALRLSRAALGELVNREVVADSPQRRALAGRLLDLGLAHVVADGTAPGLVDVTVVVPVRDNPHGVERLLVALGGVVSCIVVDDASRDAPALNEVVERHGARLIRIDQNAGPAQARNTGAAQVDTPIAAFIDSDVVISPSALETLLIEFGDPQVAAVAPRVRSRGGDRWFQRYEDAYGSLDLGKRSASVQVMSQVAYVPSAALLVRTAHLPGGGFDPTLRCAEDVDLVWRLLEAGGRVRYVADVVAWHTHRSTARAWLGRHFVYGTGAAPLAKRHGSAVAPAVLGGTSSVTVVAMAAARPASVPVLAATAARSWQRIGHDLPESTTEQRRSLIGFGLAANAKQLSGLLLRHWWPVAALVSTRSRTMRRAVIVAAVADSAVAWRARPTDLDLPRFAIARRATDLAYGAGVWWGAMKARSWRCLLPAWTRDATK